MKLFITEEMRDVIVENTNIVNADTLQTSAKYVRSGKYPVLKLSTQGEISVLLGLICYRGLYNLTDISTNILFSDTRGFLVFETVMRHDRFKFLLSKFGFDDLGANQKDGKVINLQLSESFLKNSITIVQDILHQVNFYPLMRRYIPCVIR